MMKPIRTAGTLGAAVLGLAAATLAGQAAGAGQAQKQATASDKAHQAQYETLYQAGLNDANAAQWESALAKFDQAERAAGAQGDAAMYWEAYAKSKLGRSEEALQALARLKQEYPHSSWGEDAQALDLQLRQDRGQAVSPSAQPNDDLKLLAINGLMQSDAAQALPLLEKVVHGNASAAVKSRALFVMAQNGSAAGTAELVSIAQDQQDPKLAVQAVRYLGMMGGASGGAALGKIYAGSSNLELKRSILRSYMIGGDRVRLLEAAKNETNPELKQEAIRNLALAGGKEELWQLYQTNPPTAARQSIIRALGLAGDMDHLIPLAKSEKDPELRAEAIRGLGLNGSEAAQTALVGMYAGASDRKSSAAVIHALFLHNSAAALVGLARKETDPELKRELVQRLSLMHSKVATDYLLEILNQ